MNTCEEYAGPIEAYAAAGIEQLRIPTTDFHPPTLADIERAVEFIDQKHRPNGLRECLEQWPLNEHFTPVKAAFPGAKVRAIRTKKKERDDSIDYWGDKVP